MTNKKLNINKPVTGMLAVCCCLLILLSACRKTEYNVIDSPAYLRVFNSLNYDITVTNKDLPPPFLAMVIDPKYDASGVITGGEILGDFLDRRAPYAPPYPDKAGNTSYKNSEYPGSAKVLAGPILNGIDLSSWAQIKSGKHRIVFYSRPINSTPFFSLETRYRQTLLVDSTVNIAPGEIYTMEVLQKSVAQSAILPALYIRQEQFTKTPFADSLLYVNFYNLSAEGYAAANPSAASGGIQDYFNITNKGRAYGDDMNIYYSLFTDDTEYPYALAGSPVGGTLIRGYSNVRLGRLVRSQVADVAPYYSIPMFAGRDTTGGILSRQWELFTILGAQIAPFSGFNGLVTIGSDGGFADANPNFGAIGCGNISNDGKGVEDGIRKLPNVAPKLIASNWLPNLIKYTASGKYQQRSFATISTIEIINNQVYLMSVQRSYPAPNN